MQQVKDAAMMFVSLDLNLLVLVSFRSPELAPRSAGQLLRAHVGREPLSHSRRGVDEVEDANVARHDARGAPVLEGADGDARAVGGDLSLIHI